MTRGRTGSTAVIDELKKSRSLCALQELFLIFDFDNIPDISEIQEVYDMLMPFVLWRRRVWLWKWMPRYLYSDEKLSGRYLSEAEALAVRHGASSFGFKVLSHNFEEWPFLSVLLRQRGYRVIYLTRNIARQVLSGMVANRSGLWNTKEDRENLTSYSIDLDEFAGLIQWEKQCVETDLAKLKVEGFDFIVVSYEEFYRNRQSFYEKIFQFLGLPTELPQKSDYSVIIKDLRHTISNYEAVVERAAAIGMPLDE